MAVNGNLAGINFSGLSSGIDTQGIIQKLMQIESIPLQTLQQRQQELQSQQSIYSQLSSKLSAVTTAASALNNSDAFDPISASSSDSTVAGLTASSTATSGIYNLVVNKLALAQKLSSLAQTDVTSALNLTGSFVVNGSTVNLLATDTLTDVARKINSLNVGVTASLINGGSGNAYLTLTSSKAGVANKMQLADSSGTVLGTLGLINGAPSIRESITNGATSYAFRDSSSSIGTLLGNTNLGSATVQINGVSVTINGSDSLQTIANNINAANTGATASVRQVTTTDASGNTSSTYKLDITGSGGTPTFTDANNFLQSMGVLQQGYGTQLVQAQDASYSLDGVNLTSPTNTITTAIPGVTLTLLKDSTIVNGVSQPGASSTLSLTTDVSAMKSKINDFVTAYNGLIDFVSQNSQFDNKTFQSGPLFGDPMANQAVGQVTNELFNSIPGVSGQYSNLTGLGFSIDQSNHLAVDDTKLTNALSTNPQAVSQLFRAMGTSVNPALNYISSTSKTKPSGQSAYPVNITQIATEGSYMGEMAQTQASSGNETLTFNGALFSSNAFNLIVASGSTASSLVSQINSDSTLQKLVSASLDGSGKLVIQSKRFGTNGNFTVVSNLAAGTDNSGIGTSSAGTSVTGVDVAGTINGEAATGAGQFLTGNVGDATTEGLQIQYTGAATGAVGTLSFTKGVAAQAVDLMNSFTDSVSGVLTSSNQELQTQIDDLTQQMTALQAQLTLKQQALQQKFANMETVMAQLQQQSARISSITTTNGG